MLDRGTIDCDPAADDDEAEDESVLRDDEDVDEATEAAVLMLLAQFKASWTNGLGSSLPRCQFAGRLARLPFATLRFGGIRKDQLMCKHRSITITTAIMRQT